MTYEPSAPLTNGDQVGEIRNGHRWTGTEWVRDDKLYTIEREKQAEERKKWAIGGGALILLILFGLILWWIIAADNDDEAAPTPTSMITATPAPGLGTAVQEGNLRFVVTGVVPVGKVIGTATADGSFTLVAVTVQNTSASPVAFSESNVAAIDTEDRGLDADGAAYAYAMDGGPGFKGEIAPNRIVNTFVAFDVADGASLKAVVVRQPPSADGKAINVS